MTSCSSLSHYHPASDAPERIQTGKSGFRIAATRLLVEPFTPILRRIAAPHGYLHKAAGLEKYLRANLKPLDIIVVRSKAGLTRSVIPGHFSHAAIWLGTTSQIKDIYNPAKKISQQERIDLTADKTVGEAEGERVMLSHIDKIINTNEIVIIRPMHLNPAIQRQKYKTFFSYLGTPFDKNLNYLDRKRQTCVENVLAVFPELNLPVRYTGGRLALIPDDLIRVALQPGNGFRIAQHIIPSGKDSFASSKIANLAQLISQPTSKTTKSKTGAC